MIATIYIFLFFSHALGRLFHCSPKAWFFLKTITKPPLGPITVSASVPSELLSAATVPRSVGGCGLVFFFPLILLPALFAWEVKTARKERHCLLLPLNQTLLSYWHDGVLLRKNSLLFGFWFFGFKKKLKILLSSWTLVAYCGGWNGLVVCS